MPQYRVTRRSPDGALVYNQTFEKIGTATRMYHRQLHRAPKGSHVRLTVTGHLPGMPEQVHAEHFGDHYEQR